MGKWENIFSRKHMDSVHVETLVESSWRTWKRTQSLKTQLFSLTDTGCNLRSSRSKFFLDSKANNRMKFSSEGRARTRRVMVPPHQCLNCAHVAKIPHVPRFRQKRKTKFQNMSDSACKEAWNLGKDVSKFNRVEKISTISQKLGKYFRNEQKRDFMIVSGASCWTKVIADQTNWQVSKDPGIPKLW